MNNYIKKLENDYNEGLITLKELDRKRTEYNNLIVSEKGKLEMNSKLSIENKIDETQQNEKYNSRDLNLIYFAVSCFVSLIYITSQYSFYVSDLDGVLTFFILWTGTLLLPLLPTIILFFINYFILKKSVNFFNI